MASKTPIIIFGPSGNVAAVAAAEVASAGYPTILAMRDPSKPLPDLDEHPAKDSFTRVKADLLDPTSLTTAIEQTGAKRAFIYIPQGSKDGLHASLTAMKAAGITFIAFLSSFSISSRSIKEVDAIPPEDIIAHLHARVEVSLADVFGAGNYAALRGGSFATNTLQFAKGISEGQVKVYRPDLPFDYIAHSDIGRTAASLLINPSQTPPDSIIFLLGPRQLSQQSAIRSAAKVLGKADVKITALSYEEALSSLQENMGLPPFLAKYLADKMKEGAYADEAKSLVEEGSGNVEKYTGRKALGFEEWAGQNVKLFEERIRNGAKGH